MPGVNAQLPVVEHTVVVIALVTIRPQSTVEKIVQEVTPKLRYVTKTHALVSYIIPINPLKRFITYTFILINRLDFFFL